MVDKVNAQYGFRKKLSTETMNRLIDYSWPGNIRQLENTIERILVSTEENVVDVSELPPEIGNMRNAGEGEIDLYHTPYKDLLNAFDKKILQAAIDQEGSIPKAAKLLGVDATTIRRKLNRYSG